MSKKLSIDREKFEGFIQAYADRCHIDLTSRRGVAKIKGVVQYIVGLKRIKLEGMSPDDYVQGMSNSQLLNVLLDLTEVEIAMIDVVAQEILGIALDA